MNNILYRIPQLSSSKDPEYNKLFRDIKTFRGKKKRKNNEESKLQNKGSSLHRNLKYEIIVITLIVSVINSYKMFNIIVVVHFTRFDFLA